MFHSKPTELQSFSELFGDLWGQNGGQIWNLLKILHKISVRPGLPFCFNKFWNNLVPILLVMTKVVSVLCSQPNSAFLCSFSPHLGPLLVVQFFDKLVCVLCKAFSAQLSWWIVKLFCLVIVNNYGIIDEKKCHFCCCAEFLLRKRQLLRVLFWLLLLAL